MSLRSRLSWIVSVALLTGGCGAKAFEHGDGGDSFGGFASATASAGFGDSGFSPNFDGNYPNPAVTRCGDVGEPIDRLSSAWAVIAIPDSTRGGFPVETGSMLIRLSEGAISECGEWPNADTFLDTTGFGGDPLDDDFGTERGLELMLAPSEMTLGLHRVADLESPGVMVYGEGASTELATNASVEILRIDDDCVIGIVRGFESDTGEPFMEGGFVAQTCQRQCIPSDGYSC